MGSQKMMKIARSVMLTLMVIFFGQAVALGVESTAQAAGSVSLEAKLSRLESELARLGSSMKRTAEKQTAIKSELENLRVWIHRNR